MTPTPGHSENPFIVFDLDGTLADTAGDLAESINAALKRLGLAPLTVAQVMGFVGDGSARLVARAVRAGGGAPAAEPDVARTFAGHYAEHLMDTTRPYPGVARTLEQLSRTHTLSIYSNKALAYVTPIVNQLGWDGTFAEVLGGDWGGPRKPAPDGLLEICRRLGRTPGQGWMVGDGLTDIEAGKQAGMTTVAVTYGFKPKQILAQGKPDHCCSNFADLPRLLHPMS